MSVIDKLTSYLKSTSDISYYELIMRLITNRVNEIDNSVPKLLNKAFNHRYTISRIEKAKKEDADGEFGKNPDYDAQLEDQHRQIKVIQLKIQEMKNEYLQLNKALETIELLQNCHAEINNLKKPDKSAKTGSLKYLFNTEYERKLIDSYKEGLEKEGLKPWRIESLDDIYTLPA